MKKIITTLLLAFSTHAFSQCPEIKIVMFWETKEQLQEFQNLAKVLDSNLYKIEIAPVKAYQDTALEFTYYNINSKTTRVSPYVDSINTKMNEGSFVKYYCATTGMCMGTLWCTRYSIFAIEDGYRRSHNLRNDIIAYYEKKGKH